MHPDDHRADQDGADHGADRAPDLALGGVRQAILRSALIGWLACAVVAAVASMVPAYRTINEVVDAGGVRDAVEYQAARTPMELIALVAMIGLAALGAALPRREVTAFVAGIMTVAALPLGITVAGHRPHGEALPVVHLLDACLTALLAAGPTVAALGWVLYQLERRARTRAPLPVALAR